jgi:hypothetical protein
MKPKAREVLELAVEQGVARGYRRAHKHVENPTEEAIMSSIEECVMSAIYDWFEFDEGDG